MGGVGVVSVVGCLEALSLSVRGFPDCGVLPHVSALVVRLCVRLCAVVVAWGPGGAFSRVVHQRVSQVFGCGWDCSRVASQVATVVVMALPVRR